MIHHLLLITRRADLSDDDDRRFREAIDSLATIEGVLDLVWGENFSNRARGYTHGAVLRFENREALDAYAVHPTHLKAVEILNDLAPERLVLDYETGTSVISAP